MFQLVVAQEIASSIYFPPNQKPGNVIWVRTRDVARHLVETGQCTWPKGTDAPIQPGKPMRRPDGWPVDRFAVIEPVWKGQPVVCIGGGPSVTPEQVEYVRGKARVIAVNDAYLLAPWAEICYFADSRWWEWHTKGIAKPKLGLTAQDVARRFKEFAGQKVSIENTGLMVSDPDVFILHNATREHGNHSLSTRRNAIATGSNGGYQAVNIAVLAGGNPVILLGYDMRYAGGKTSHWHGGHPLAVAESAYQNYARQFANMRGVLKSLGVQVFNCAPNSLIDAFPKVSLESVLPPTS